MAAYHWIEQFRMRVARRFSTRTSSHGSGMQLPPREFLAFLPAALEVVETPVSPTIRATYLSICGLVVLALLWSILSHIETVAVASGKIAPLGQVKVVQALETSAIRAIYVRDGDHVASGQNLVDLDPTDVTTELSSLLYDQEQAALDLEVASFLMAVDLNRSFIVERFGDKRLAETNHARAKAELSRFRAQTSNVNSEIAQKEATRDANEIVGARARAIIPLLEEKNANAQTLYDKRFGLRIPVLDSEQQLIEKRAEVTYSIAYGRQIESEILSLMARRDEISATFWVDASDRHIKASQKLAGLVNQIEKARTRESYRKLLAPVSGTVQGLKIHTPGAVVTSADILMTIVPDGVGLEVEALVENKDIGFVREGQKAEIKIEAFPFTRFGLVHGAVRKVSRDAVVPQTTSQSLAAGMPNSGSGANAGAAVTSYAAKVSLDQDWISIGGAAERLQPGMNVTVEIKTGERRVIEYLISPVLKTISEAGRER